MSRIMAGTPQIKSLTALLTLSINASMKSLSPARCQNIIQRFLFAVPRPEILLKPLKYNEKTKGGLQTAAKA